MKIKSTIPQFVSQNCQIVQLITQFEFHDLYTPSATMALQNGVDVKTVSSMFDHYSAGFTLDT